MFIVLSVALGAAYLHYPSTATTPPDIPNFISTKGPRVGLNFRRPALLAHVSTVVRAFKEKVILRVRPLQGIKLCRVVKLTVTPRIFKLFRAEAFITLYERLARSASRIDV